MPVTIMSITFRFDGAAIVADIVFVQTGKAPEPIAGGPNQFTVRGIPRAAAASLSPGDQKILSLA